MVVHMYLAHGIKYHIITNFMEDLNRTQTKGLDKMTEYVKTLGDLGESGRRIADLGEIMYKVKHDAQCKKLLNEAKQRTSY